MLEQFLTPWCYRCELGYKNTESQLGSPSFLNLFVDLIWQGEEICISSLMREFGIALWFHIRSLNKVLVFPYSCHNSADTQHSKTGQHHDSEQPMAANPALLCCSQPSYHKDDRKWAHNIHILPLHSAGYKPVTQARGLAKDNILTPFLY